MIVEEHSGVGRSICRRNENIKSASELQKDLTLLGYSGRKCRRDHVCRAAYNRCPFGKTCGSCGFSRYCSQDFMRRNLRRDCCERKMGEGDEFRRKFICCNIDEPGFESPVLLDASFPGQPPVYVIVGTEHGRDPYKDVRLMALDPAHFRGDQLLIYAVACLGDEVELLNLFTQFNDFRCNPAITLLDAWPEKLPILVQKNNRRKHSGHTNADNFRCRDVCISN